MKHLQKICSILAFLMIFTLLVSMMPSNTVKAASYQDWKQYDSRWGSQSLGNNGTMSSWGCKITSLAILMVHAGVENESTFNPGVLRDRYENAGYITHASSISADGNLLDDATSQSFSPKFYYVNSHYYPTESFATIRSDISSLLNSGYYVEVRVKNNGHSVAVNYCSENEVYIMDPGSTINTLSSFDGGIYGVNYYKAQAVPSKTPTPTEDLSASNYNYPTVLNPGQAFSIRGTVTSKSSNIKSLTAGVYTKDGKAKTTKTVRPNARTYFLSNVDPYVYFDKLAPGTYVYMVTATNSSRTKTVIKQTFTVKDDPITASGYNYPKNLKRGQPFSIRGTVTSSTSKIKSLTCGAYATKGSLETSKTVRPNSKSYNLKNLDAYIRFDKLTPGVYEYRVCATNTAGTKIVIRRRFTVSKEKYIHSAK